MSRGTEIIYFQGKGSFFHHLQKGDQEYKNWNVRLHFDDASAAKFEQLQQDEGEVQGIMNEVKLDVDGKFHHFKRPFFKNFGKGDEALAPPIMEDDKGHPWDRNILIGSGSDITVGCELYVFKNKRTKKMGKAIRLASVRIEHLVPYSRESYTDTQGKLIKGLDGVPKQEGWSG